MVSSGPSGDSICHLCRIVRGPLARGECRPASRESRPKPAGFCEGIGSTCIILVPRERRRRVYSLPVCDGAAGRWTRPSVAQHGSRSRGEEPNERQPDRCRVQGRTEEQPAEDGPVHQFAQPDRGRAARPQRLRLAADRLAARPDGLRDAVHDGRGHRQRRREVAGAGDRLRRPRRHPAGAGRGLRRRGSCPTSTTPTRPARR